MTHAHTHTPWLSVYFDAIVAGILVIGQALRKKAAQEASYMAWEKAVHQVRSSTCDGGGAGGRVKRVATGMGHGERG